MSLIDTHVHFDFAVFDLSRQQLMTEAAALGITQFVVPAVGIDNCERVLALSEQHAEFYPALGIHPLWSASADPAHIDQLAEYLQRSEVVAVGEIGLDYFTPQTDTPRQLYYFEQQLKLAHRFDLPVLLHVRKAVDAVLQQLRQVDVCGGIVHAFNGSLQQAQQFIAMGFKLGFGGALTFERARKIRSLAQMLPLDSIVLETDAPDMAPAWLPKGVANSPLSLYKIAQTLAQLRGQSLEAIIEATSNNARQVLTKIAD